GSYNLYFGWYIGELEQNDRFFDDYHKKFPNRVIGFSEYGADANPRYQSMNAEKGDYSETYQCVYHEHLLKCIENHPYLWATHAWNLFDFAADGRDEGGKNGENQKGLVTFDRKLRKDAFYLYKAYWSKEPFVHLCGKRYVDRVEDVTKVTVYSNQPEVELFADGKSLGKKTAEDHFFYFDVPNKGKTKLVAVAGDLKDEGMIRKVETPNESYRLREKGAILNWFDITEVDGCFSLNDKLSDIMACPEGQQLFAGMMKQMMSSGGKDSMMGAGFEMTPALMQMMGGFTVVRLMSLMGAANVKVTKEQLLGLNAMLNTIKKPQ
ncbi:MAG: glycoside hydrolase family 2 protein, partial [Clostridia bacterium]|nr:glycoside hydrolase family 2 protein [Clostridia bacterium]